jgi:hypothetical protein
VFGKDVAESIVRHSSVFSLRRRFASIGDVATGNSRRTLSNSKGNVRSEAWRACEDEVDAQAIGRTDQVMMTNMWQFIWSFYMVATARSEAKISRNAMDIFKSRRARQGPY